MRRHQPFRQRLGGFLLLYLTVYGAVAAIILGMAGGAMVR